MRARIADLCRTIIETLQGLAWALLVFFICSLLAFVMVRVFEMRKSKGETKAA